MRLKRAAPTAIMNASVDQQRFLASSVITEKAARLEFTARLA
ncbi:hypothetical protein [Hydrocarboniphaga sp.]